MKEKKNNYFRADIITKALKKVDSWVRFGMALNRYQQ